MTITKQLTEKQLNNWKNYGLEEAWATDDPKGAKLLLLSGFVDKILTYQRSSNNPAYTLEKQIQRNGEHIQVKVKGEFQNVGEYFSGCKVDDLRNSFEYFADSGVETFDRRGKAPLRPIFQLDNAELKQLQKHASSDGKKYVVQIVNHVSKGIIHSNHSVNLKKHAPHHCSIRLINENGDVYSFGKSIKEMTDGAPLETTNGTVCQRDFRELSSNMVRVTTSLGINQAQFSEILSKMNNYRENGKRFNYLHKNCQQLGIEVLEIAGVEDYHIRKTFKEIVVDSLPEFTKVPVIKFIAIPLQFISNTTPDFIKTALRIAIWPATFILNTGINFILNMLMLLAGSNTGTKTPDGHPEKLSTYEKIGWRMFSEDLLYTESPERSIHWQLTTAKDRTYVHSSKTTKVHVLPPNSPSEDEVAADKRMREIFA